MASRTGGVGPRRGRQPGRAGASRRSAVATPVILVGSTGLVILVGSAGLVTPVGSAGLVTTVGSAGPVTTVGLAGRVGAAGPVTRRVRHGGSASSSRAISARRRSVVTRRWNASAQ